VTPCEWCGALPRGVGGSAGIHRRDCPGGGVLELIASLRVDVAQMIAALTLDPQDAP